MSQILQPTLEEEARLLVLEKARRVMADPAPPWYVVVDLATSPLLPPEVAWELLMGHKEPILLRFARERKDPEGVAFIRKKRAWAFQHLEEALRQKEGEAHLALLLWRSDLPPDPEELRLLQEALPKLVEVLEGGYCRYPDRNHAYDTAESLLKMALFGGVALEALPEEAWFRVLRKLRWKLRSDTLRDLTHKDPRWAQLVARIDPDLVCLPPEDHPDRREIAVLSLHAVLLPYAYPRSAFRRLREDEAEALLPEALGRGHWIEALGKLLQRPSLHHIPFWLGDSLERADTIPFFPRVLEAFLPKASPEALAFLLILLPEGATDPLRRHLEGLPHRDWKGRESFSRALWREEPRKVIPALKRLEGWGLLPLALEGEWWRGTVLEDRKGRVFPLRKKWEEKSVLADLPLPVLQVLLKKADSHLKAWILEVAGDRLPRESWERYLTSPSHELSRQVARLLAREWYRDLVREFAAKGYEVPPEDEVLRAAARGFREEGAPPLPVPMGEFLLLWFRGDTNLLYLSSPWGWLGLRGVDGYGGASRPPSLEEVWHALGLALSLPPEAVRFLLGLGGERAFRALKALAETADNPAEREEVLREALEASEWAHLLRILLAQDLLRI